VNGKPEYLSPRIVARLANMSLVARSVVEGYAAGLHKSPFHGASVEFAEYRQYTPGDDLRHFDWKVYAKTDRTYVRLFEEETNLTAHLVVDASRSMAYSSDGMSKFDYAAHIAAALAYVLIAQRDTVGLLTVDDEIRSWIPPKGAGGQLKTILDTLEATSCERTTRLSKALHLLAGALKRRGLVVVVSDLLEEPAEVMKALKHLRHDKHELIVFHVLDSAELRFPFKGLHEFRDLETGDRLVVDAHVLRDKYIERVNSAIDALRRECRVSGIDYVVADTSVPADDRILRYLGGRARAK